VVFFKERRSSAKRMSKFYIYHIYRVYIAFIIVCITSEKFNFEDSIFLKLIISECCKLVHNKSFPFSNIQRTILSVSRNAQIKIISPKPPF